MSRLELYPLVKWVGGTCKLEMQCIGIVLCCFRGTVSFPKPANLWKNCLCRYWILMHIFHITQKTIDSQTVITEDLKMLKLRTTLKKKNVSAIFLLKNLHGHITPCLRKSQSFLPITTVLFSTDKRLVQSFLPYKTSITRQQGRIIHLLCTIYID